MKISIYVIDNNRGRSRWGFKETIFNCLSSILYHHPFPLFFLFVFRFCSFLLVPRCITRRTCFYIPIHYTCLEAIAIVHNPQQSSGNHRAAVIGVVRLLDLITRGSSQARGRYSLAEPTTLVTSQQQSSQCHHIVVKTGEVVPKASNLHCRSANPDALRIPTLCRWHGSRATAVAA